MNETERIAAMLRGLDCPHADDDYNICRACAAEAAETIDAQAATIEQLQQHIARIEAETKSWIDDLIAEGGARKVGPLEHILAVIRDTK